MMECHYAAETPECDNYWVNRINLILELSDTHILVDIEPSTFCSFGFLDFADDETLNDRIVERYSEEGSDVVDRRLAHAEYERSAKTNYDYVITSNSPEQIAHELLKIILSRSSALPQRSLSLPGPLADVDIRASLETLDSRINGWSVDLTLGPRFYLVVHRRRVFRRVFDLAPRNSTDMLKRFKECVVAEGKGIFLKPQEFILASTTERLYYCSTQVGDN